MREPSRIPERGIAMIKQLESLNEVRNPYGDGKSGSKLPPVEAMKIAREKGKLAMPYARSKDYRNAAKVYHEIAPLDPATQVRNLKEAASALFNLGKIKKRSASRSKQTRPGRKHAMISWPSSFIAIRVVSS